MMKGDDFESLHFMMLKSEKVAGEWGIQYVYGKTDKARKGPLLILLRSKSWLINLLTRQREFYSSKARYLNNEQKSKQLGYFAEAINKLTALK